MELLTAGQGSARVISGVHLVPADGAAEDVFIPGHLHFFETMFSWPMASQVFKMSLKIYFTLE